MTIALGRWRKGFKYQIRRFECEVSYDEDGGQSFECLSIHCYDYDGSIVSLHLWEDQTAQVQVSGRKHNFSFQPDISNLTPEGVYEALKQSVSIGNFTDTIPEIWEHEGEILR